MNDQILLSIAQEMGADSAFIQEEVQSLWSGYGQILRVGLSGAEESSVIVKWVDPPSHEGEAHPRGFGGQISHRRKLRSYEVERNFYQSYALQKGAARVARSFSCQSQPTGWLFVLEDLDAHGFSGRTHDPQKSQVEGCLRWLAEFHAQWLGVTPTGLWEEGSYWHLATRPEEYAALSDGSLKQAAETWSDALKSCRFQTLIHGDAKIANFCLSSTGQVAAVDFQYVGGGVGVKDVAYFLSSIFDEVQLQKKADGCLNFYFSELKRALVSRVDSTDVSGRRFDFSDDDLRQLEESWRALYPIAWADFYRFLAGWAPGHYKIHGYSKAMTDSALQSSQQV